MMMMSSLYFCVKYRRVTHKNDDFAVSETKRMSFHVFFVFYKGGDYCISHAAENMSFRNIPRSFSRTTALVLFPYSMVCRLH